MLRHIIRDREKLAEQIRALGELTRMAATYGCDVSRPATTAHEAVQWLYLGYLAAVKEQNGAAMSLGRTSTFLDVHLQRDLDEGIIDEIRAQELIDDFVIKLQIARRFQPNLTVLWSPRLPRGFKEFCAEASIDTSAVQYESDELMRPRTGDDTAIACCVSAMAVGKQMQFFGARVNLAKALLYAINGGRDEMSGEQIAPNTPALNGEYLEYAELTTAYDWMLDWLAATYVDTLNVIRFMRLRACGDGAARPPRRPLHGLRYRRPVRRLGQPFAPGANPMNGRERHGVAASALSVAKLPYEQARDGISLTTTITPEGLGHHPMERAGNLVGVLDTSTASDGFHMNVNALDRATLEDPMEHPEKYQELTIRVSGYAVNFVRLTREQQLDVISRTFHGTR